MSGMTPVILVGLIVVLLAAAAYVGVLLVRRSRSAPVRPEPAVEPTAERPRTVADLLKQRTAPAAELTGDGLFVPAVPRQDGVAVPAMSGGRAGEPAAVPPSPQPPTPANGLEIGDAPWRRAARMTGAEPGGAWETAPVPVVAASATSTAGADGAGGAVAPAERRTATTAPATTAPATTARPSDAPLSDVSPSDVSPSARSADAPASPAVVIAPVPASAPASLTDPAPQVPTVPSVPEQAPADGPEPVPARLASAWTEPASAAVTDAEPAQADPVDIDPVDPQEAVTEAAPEPTASGGPVVSPDDAPVAVSRPLSDPDLTPLMGIPIIRPVTTEASVPETVPERPQQPAIAEEPAAAASDGDPDTGPVSRIGAPEQDDDVVVLLSPTFTSSFPTVAPAVSGSSQPVWFRVVRRDGEPVAAAVVALLDDHGREVDTTKTATDGGGELHTSHGGRFLMIVGADGYQPRAVTLSVDEEPVELALLLPRSATASGSVRRDGEVVRDARVVVRQDHDVVDEALTGGDGHYRFDDLAEGAYTVTATGGPGRAVAQLRLVEGADVHVDLDLVGPGDAG